MNFDLIILERAQKEIEEAYDYYHRISESVLRSFDEDLEEVYSALEINPFYELRYGQLRALPFRRFPYLVFFKVVRDAGLVYIYSVFHTSQDPAKYP